MSVYIPDQTEDKKEHEQLCCDVHQFNYNSSDIRNFYISMNNFITTFKPIDRRNVSSPHQCRICHIFYGYVILLLYLDQIPQNYRLLTIFALITEVVISKREQQHIYNLYDKYHIYQILCQKYRFTCGRQQHLFILEIWSMYLRSLFQ